MSDQSHPTAPAAQPLIQPDSRRNVIGAVILLGLVVLGSGMLHFTYGGNIGCHVIIKDEWAMHDTFVNMEELESMSMFEAMLDGHKGLIRALIREEIIENPFEDY